MRIVLVALALGMVAVATARAELRLIPEPAKVTAGSGRMSLPSNVVIAVENGDDEDRFAAGLLRDEIAAITGGTPRVTDGKSGSIVLTRDRSAADLGDEGYRLEVTGSAARARARTAAGLYYAVQTLRQMIEPDGIPAAVIEDRPALRWRGIQDDISRGPLPRVTTLEQRIANAAHLKLNLYVLYLETALEYRGHPLLSTPGSVLTQDEVRQLVAFGKQHHVELVPEQQTTAHMSNVLRLERYSELAETPRGSTLAPGPASVAFVRSLYDELDPLFPGPFFHLGVDEAGAIGEGRSASRVAGSSHGAVYVEHLKSLVDALRPHGRRLMIWGDGLVENPALIRDVPHDLVIASWNYDAVADYGKWIRPFRDAGLDVMVCPGAANWTRVFPNLDVALPNIRDFVRDGKRAGALGAITCMWDDRGDGLFDPSWYAIAGGAAASWQSAELDTNALRKRFDWVLFRSPGTGIADAIGQLQQCHRLVNRVRPHDANLDLFWQHPLNSPMDTQLLGGLAEIAGPLRLDAELAIEQLARARSTARMNRETIDQLSFAARRMRAIGVRATIARQVPTVYARMLAARVPGATITEPLKYLNQIREMLGEGLVLTSQLREEHERLWLQDNLPYALGVPLALYDRDSQVWASKLDAIRQCELLIRFASPLPTAEQMGLPPGDTDAVPAASSASRKPIRR